MGITILFLMIKGDVYGNPAPTEGDRTTASGRVELLSNTSTNKFDLLTKYESLYQHLLNKYKIIMNDYFFLNIIITISIIYEFLF